jgi:hypothetical protein
VHYASHFARRDKNALFHAVYAQKAIASAIGTYSALDGVARSDANACLRRGAAAASA